MSRRRNKKYQSPQKRSQPQQQQLTPKQQAEQTAQTIQRIRTEMFSGPLPAPEVLKRYDDTVPGAAERIITMAEQQSQHRRALETAVIEADICSARRGSVFGFVLGSMTVVGGLTAIFLDKNIEGLAAIITALASLVAIFVIGSRRRKKERLAKYGRDIKSATDPNP